MAAETDGDDPVTRATENCMVSQSMIDITAKKLFDLRTRLQYRTTEDLIQNEIRESEGKLIKMISRQLVAKARLDVDEMPEKLQEYPKTDQWFKIVGIEGQTAQALLDRDVTLESLLEMSEDEIERLMARYRAEQLDTIRLNSALRKLRLWTESQLQEDRSSVTEKDLYWSNYKTTPHNYSGNSPKFCSQRPSTSSLPPELNPQSPQSPASTPTPPQSTPASPLPYPSPAEQRRRYTPPPTPPLVKPSKGKFPTTPPPKKRNKLYPDVFHPLSKSKSHESQLSMKVNQDNVDISRYLKKKPDNLTITGSFDALNQQRKRSAGDVAVPLSGQTSPLISSPKPSPPYKAHLDQQGVGAEVYDVHPNKKNQLVVPVSPTPLPNRSMMHSIKHRFQNKWVMGACDFCHKHVIGQGRICRHCKLKFHRDCASRAAPTCGLPDEYLDAFIEAVRHDGSPGLGRHNHSVPGLAGAGGDMVHANSVPHFQAPDSSSTTSSCTSSTPSSPALFFNTTSSSSAQPSPHIQITTDTQTQFHFPDHTYDSVGSNSVTDTIDSIGTASSLSYDAQSVIEKSDIVNTNTSNDSDKSDKTLIDTAGSGGGDSSGGRASSYGGSSLLERTDSIDSTDDAGSKVWERVNSISVTMKEWDIPYEELQFDYKIGTGRYAVVHKGNWHGDVAIKMLNMEPDTDNQAQLTAFKLEVAILRKTRHENLVLFMGACMRPPHLAIVTSLCKGWTLYNYIHVRKEKMPMNKTIIIASQIAQGMGYLHAKSIIHKDLKSKNVFIEAGKVVITDFGLFNVTKLCHGNRKGNWLNIPPGWLCYLAPEIMRSLKAASQDSTNLPFTQASDVYAFGTVWYELLVGDWPFKHQPPEAVIWQVGKGIKQAIGNIQASRDVKEFLMNCWSYKPEIRPGFVQLTSTLEKLPKKRLARSPSHPVQLSRSAESVF